MQLRSSTTSGQLDIFRNAIEKADYSQMYPQYCNLVARTGTKLQGVMGSTFSHFLFSYWRGKSYIAMQEILVLENWAIYVDWSSCCCCCYCCCCCCYCFILLMLLFICNCGCTITDEQQHEQQNYTVTTTTIRTKRLSNLCRLIFFLLLLLLLLLLFLFLLLCNFVVVAVHL